VNASGAGKGGGVVNASGVAKAGPSSGPFTSMPLPPRNVQPQSNHDEVDGQRLRHTPANGTVPVFVDVKPPVPVPVGMKDGQDAERGENSASPIIVIDDSDEDEGRVTKKRKVGESGSNITVG